MTRWLNRREHPTCDAALIMADLPGRYTAISEKTKRFRSKRPVRNVASASCRAAFLTGAGTPMQFECPASHALERRGRAVFKLLSVLKLPLPLGEVGRGSGRERAVVWLLSFWVAT